MTKAPLLLTQERGFGFFSLYNWAMRNKSIDNAMAWLLIITGSFVALFVTVSSTADPVNVPKMLVLTIFAFLSLGLLISQWRDLLKKEVHLVVASSGIFILAILLSMIFSAAPFSQKFYGMYGRNTGFLTYFSLVLIFLSTALIRKPDFSKNLLRSLMFVGTINVLYCLLELTGNDPLPWNNTYNTILGTFGNPDFISAFLGMTVIACLAWLVAGSTTLRMRGLSVLYIGLALFEIKKSHAIQGLAVTAIGAVVIGYFVVRSIFRNRISLIVYLALMSAGGLIAALGALQKGPLVGIMYKTSVSLRGEYWAAAINTFKSHPIFGVGMDSFGDWYRIERRPSAMVLPGPTTVVNTAHNVFLDMLANGGLILFVSYILILTLGGVSVIRIARRSKNFDVTFVALTSVWIGYQAQSFISINQIGLAIWGWLLTGALIAYEYSTRETVHAQTALTNSKQQRKRVRVDSALPASSIFTAPVLGLVGLLVALPPFVADTHWREALQASSVERIQAAAIAWPLDSTRLGIAVNAMLQNKFNTQALELSRLAVKFNPNSYDSWNLMSAVPDLPAKEKQEAIKRLRELDPLNPNLKNLK